MSVVEIRPFFPSGATVSIAATSTSAGSTISQATSKNPNQAGTLRVLNAGTAVIFFRQGAGAQTAAATDVPVAPGVTEVFQLQGDTDHVAAICPVGSGTIYFTPGQGS